ncbi:MAG: aminopeptidase, partial [Planctomycetaceae bacterium]
MKDPRIERLAQVLLHHSCRIQSGQKVLIEAIDLPDPALVCRLVEIASQAGATPLVIVKNNAIQRALYRTATETGMMLAGDHEAGLMRQMDAYIGIRGSANSNEFADVPGERMDLYQKHWWQPVHIQIRVPQTRWVVLRYPTPSMAQAANKSCEAFEDFYFDVCTADYVAMARDLLPLKARMEAADQVRITAPGTELSCSIRNIPVLPCAGEGNIPDGDSFTAAVSVC